MSIPDHHPYDFDPTYGFSLEGLRALRPPEAPVGFEAFWRARYERALGVATAPRLSAGSGGHPGWIVHDITYASTDDFRIGGWLLLPQKGDIRRGLVVGHGYGGREAPDFALPLEETAVLFPCFRGLSRSRQAFRIVLPQAMRSILPNGFNAIIGLAKGTSVVYILALPELFYTIQIIYRRNLEVIPLLMVATVWYLVILTVLTLVQQRIERHYSRGALRNVPASFFKRLKREQAAAPVQAPVVQANAAVPGWAARRVSGGEVSVHGVTKHYGLLRVLDEVSLTVPAGAVTVILGPSGSGKSTLLRSINHLERVDRGFIAVDGELIGYRQQGDTLYELAETEVLHRRVDVGMVFQNFNLFPHLTVLENVVEAPIAVRGLKREEAEAQARELLARVGLADKAASYPRQLSGGQQQRVAIARALALKPKVLLFDEPTSALDPELVGEVLDVIKELARSGTTLVIVTHEIGFAREVADTVVFMENGRILESGNPAQVFSAPRHPRTAAFLDKVL